MYCIADHYINPSNAFELPPPRLSDRIKVTRLYLATMPMESKSASPRGAGVATDSCHGLDGHEYGQHYRITGQPGIFKLLN